MKCCSYKALKGAWLLLIKIQKQPTFSLIRCHNPTSSCSRPDGGGGLTGGRVVVKEMVTQYVCMYMCGRASI